MSIQNLQEKGLMAKQQTMPFMSPTGSMSIQGDQQPMSFELKSNGLQGPQESQPILMGNGPPSITDMADFIKTVSNGGNNFPDTPVNFNKARKHKKNRAKMQRKRMRGVMNPFDTIPLGSPFEASDDKGMDSLPTFNPFNIGMGMNPFDMMNDMAKKPMVKIMVIKRPLKNLKGASNVNEKTPMDMFKGFDNAFDNFFDDIKKPVNITNTKTEDEKEIKETEKLRNFFQTPKVVNFKLSNGEFIIDKNDTKTDELKNKKEIKHENEKNVLMNEFRFQDKKIPDEVKDKKEVKHTNEKNVLINEFKDKIKKEEKSENNKDFVKNEIEEKVTKIPTEENSTKIPIVETTKNTKEENLFTKVKNNFTRKTLKNVFYFLVCFILLFCMIILFKNLSTRKHRKRR